jgi:FMN phosphatase YigB (HAD superfamily)
MSAPKAIIFDLGNVLLPIDLSLTYEAFATYSSLSSSEIASAILELQLWVPYEVGQQTDVEFRDFLRSHLDLTISDADFEVAALALPEIVAELKGATPKKVIARAPKLVNIVL